MLDVSATEKNPFNVIEHLRAAGQSTLDFAKSIDKRVVVAALLMALGIEQCYIDYWDADRQFLPLAIWMLNMTVEQKRLLREKTEERRLSPSEESAPVDPHYHFCPLCMEEHECVEVECELAWLIICQDCFDNY